MADYGWVSGLTNDELTTYYGQLKAQLLGSATNAGRAVRAVSSGEVSIERETVANPQELMAAISQEGRARGLSLFTHTKYTKTSIRYVG